MSITKERGKLNSACMPQLGNYNSEMETITALIVAAGRGTRAGGGTPKQYRNLNGKAVLTRTIEAMLRNVQINAVRCVIHPDDQDLYTQVTQSIGDVRLQPPVIGGETRSQSVLNGLTGISTDFVLIHDGARPLVPQDAVARIIAGVRDTKACFLAIPVTDALWRVDDGVATDTLPRDTLWRGQTPQAFATDLIKGAHAQATKPADDDVAIARNAGITVTPIIGAEENIKITHASDFTLASRLIGDVMDVRVGNGYDVHALGDGDHVILNGIKIPHIAAMIGHSDADVAMHTITDAIFGALSEGDIGQWFPPSDDQWKGASSDIFLRKAVERAFERGFTISNIDCTIICEMPKIGPHAQVMRENLAEITGIDIDRISVKATTSEKLGFTGRGEGIAAQATTTLVKT
jgi:2-C-methyl-D-erythritol 4-phosphate cytidylyltransferase/2-C-methyl-D-erythritol 2,4-cyclodiphosphate synthase